MQDTAVRQKTEITQRLRWFEQRPTGLIIIIAEKNGDWSFKEKSPFGQTPIESNSTLAAIAETCQDWP